MKLHNLRVTDDELRLILYDRAVRAFRAAGGGDSPLAFQGSNEFREYRMAYRQAVNDTDPNNG
ncbi:MAG: hypothetical protein GEU78_08025 [Actinobacteria bacterium]|nr:hypothetical protein [Actinomycetota bacterium]